MARRLIFPLALIGLLAVCALILLVLAVARTAPPTGLVFSQFERERGRYYVYLDPYSGVALERRAALHDVEAATIPMEPAPHSPDETRTVMPRVTEDGVDLFVEDASGTLTRITRLQDFPSSAQLSLNMRSNTHPLWSPDGRWISFISADPLARMDLYLVSADGEGLRRIYLDVSTPTPLNLRWLPLPEQPFPVGLLAAALAGSAALVAWNFGWFRRPQAA